MRGRYTDTVYVPVQTPFIRGRNSLQVFCEWKPLSYNVIYYLPISCDVRHPPRYGSTWIS